MLHYRRVVPAALRRHVGVGTISRSLGARTLDHTALGRWIEADRDAERRLADARATVGETATTTVTATGAKTVSPIGASMVPTATSPILIDARACMSALAVWKEREIGRQSLRLHHAWTDPKAWERFERRRHEIRDRLIAHGDSTGLPGIGDLLRDALREDGTVIPTDEATVAVLRPAFQEALAEVQRVIDSLIAAKQTDAQQSTYTDDTGSMGACPAPAVADPTSTAEASRDGLRLSELADAYLTGSDANPDYAEDLRTYVRRLQESLGGDRSVEHISKRDMVRFRDQISKLPARPLHSQRRKPILELVELAERERAEGIGRPRLTSKTVKKWLDHLGAMFRYGLANELSSANPIVGVKPPKARDPEPPRQPFSQDEVRLIFNSPLYQGHAGDAYRSNPGTHIVRDSKFWLPLLGLYTGCRREEMAQARVADVKSEDGITFLHITTLVQDKGREKRLKTAGARRMVPLHRAVLEAGFLEHVAALRRRGEIYLFPDLNHTAREPAGAFGKWFDRFCRRLVEVNGLPLGQGIDHPSRTFHSFRHTFKRACRDAEIGKEVHDELTGHAGAGDVGQSYGRTNDGRFSLRVLNAAVQRIEFSGALRPAP